MKKLFTLILLIASSVAIARADYFDIGMTNLVVAGSVHEIHVSKSMLDMVSPQVRNKIPLLGKVDGITAVTVYTIPDKAALTYCYNNLAVAFQNTNGVTRNLLTNADGQDYVAIYGTLHSEDTDYYDRIIMFTNNGETGQILVVYGTITNKILSEIAGSVAK